MKHTFTLKSNGLTIVATLNDERRRLDSYEVQTSVDQFKAACIRAMCDVSRFGATFPHQVTVKEKKR